MAKRKSPAQTRVQTAVARRRGLGNALFQLQLDFTSKESREHFMQWRNDPRTLLFIDCLRELGITPPVAYIDTADVGVQYGVSSGLGLAAELLNDPSAIFPYLFSGATPGQPPTMPEPDFSYADPESAGSDRR